MIKNTAEIEYQDTVYNETPLMAAEIIGFRNCSTVNCSHKQVVFWFPSVLFHSRLLIILWRIKRILRKAD